MKREAVRRMANDGHPRQPRSQPAHEAALRGMGVHDLIALAAQKTAQPDETQQVPERTDPAADDVQVDDAERLPLERFLDRRVGGQNIYLPAVCLPDAAQPENDPGNPAVARSPIMCRTLIRSVCRVAVIRKLLVIGGSLPASQRE